MRRVGRASLATVAALSTAVLTAAIADAPAWGSTKPKVAQHKKSATITAAKVCSLLTSAQGAALLDESGQTATAVPQSQGICSWGTQDGSNVEVDVVHTSSPVHGCNGQPGKVVTVAGWKGCFNAASPSLTASKGQTYVEMTFNVLPTQHVSQSVCETEMTQIFKGLDT